MISVVLSPIILLIVFWSHLAHSFITGDIIDWYEWSIALVTTLGYGGYFLKTWLNK